MLEQKGLSATYEYATIDFWYMLVGVSILLFLIGLIVSIATRQPICPKCGSRNTCFLGVNVPKDAVEMLCNKCNEQF